MIDYNLFYFLMRIYTSRKRLFRKCDKAAVLDVVMIQTFIAKKKNTPYLIQVIYDVVG